jgi:hypothetical protein
MMVASLAGMCAGFFAIHAAAAGALNGKLTTSRGRANALYILFYYAGGIVESPPLALRISIGAGPRCWRSAL